MANHLEEAHETPRDHAVCFAEALAEELVEVDALRRKKNKRLAPGESPTWPKVQEIAEKAGTMEREDKGGEEAAREAKTVVNEAREMKLAGLAFSGGGIRSATFNLGVLQGLAQYNKIRTFDYLSTVSGGGYIGNWLEAWILRSGQEQTIRTTDPTRCKRDVEIRMQLVEIEVQDAELDVQVEELNVKVAEIDAQDAGIDVVEQELRPTRTARLESVERAEWKDQKSHTEPPPIRFLRDYGNYLTPRLGVLGADTWTIIAIYFRSLLLNQAVLTLFLFALLLLPYIAFYLTKASCPTWGWEWTAPIVVFASMTWALSVGARNMRGLIDCRQKPERRKPWLPPQEQGWVIRTIVVPVFVAQWILTNWLWQHTGNWDTAQNRYWWPLAGIALLGLPMSISCLFAPHQRDDGVSWDLRNPKLVWFLASLGGGAAGGLIMLAAVHEVFKPVKLWCGSNWHELSLGVPLTLVVFLATATIQVGLMGRTFFDPYREWWARVAGWILILTIMWAAGFGLAIYAPLGLLRLPHWLKAAGGLAWIASTASGVLGAKSAKTGAPDEAAGVKVTLLWLTPYVFILGLMSLLSFSLELILARISRPFMAGEWNTFLAGSPDVEKAVNWVLNVSGNATAGALTISGTAAPTSGSVPSGAPAYIQAHFKLLDQVTSGWLIPVCFFVVFCVCCLLSTRVDLNEFSMNLLYRNRLVRCYLGATHEKREANPFSGLDCSDDLFLSTLRSSESYSGPLPILNGTLNLVNSRDLAWQERKAESFPMTPLRCGFDTWIEQGNLEKNYALDTKMGDAASISKYAYRPTEKYGYKDQGFYVGTAMSISGAAASPNMGYHSVPSLAMLMTFFNVRLGFWAGNPRNENTWTHPGPTFGLWQLLCELFGLTDDNAKYVYLSDGGHFENLGVYELVKRRCKYIVVCDASADPNYSLGDLGNAIRKCREDIGVEIELDTTPVMLKGSGENGNKNKNDGESDGDDNKLTSQHFAVGTIRYDMADPKGEKGVFVYIKASLTGDEPGDVLSYQTAHKTFPHESTVDQWFAESQFESYRRLGQHIVETLFAGREGTTAYEDLTSEEHLQAFRELPTDKLFEKLREKWLPKEDSKHDRKHGSVKS